MCMSSNDAQTYLLTKLDTVHKSNIKINTSKKLLKEQRCEIKFDFMYCLLARRSFMRCSKVLTWDFRLKICLFFLWKSCAVHVKLAHSRYSYFPQLKLVEWLMVECGTWGGARAFFSLIGSDWKVWYGWYLKKI